MFSRFWRPKDTKNEDKKRMSLRINFNQVFLNHRWLKADNFNLNNIDIRINLFYSQKEISIH